MSLISTAFGTRHDHVDDARAKVTPSENEEALSTGQAMTWNAKSCIHIFEKPMMLDNPMCKIYAVLKRVKNGSSWS